MNRPISDARQRDAAIDTTRSFIVQAPAGSGKTELLIRRCLALLAVSDRPEEILAITFTRKAAGEMRFRLLEALRKAREPCPTEEHHAQTWKLARAALERDRRLGWNLMENPSRLDVRTIDSLSAALVRRMPWTTRLGGMPRVMEDARVLYREAAARTLDRIRQGTGEGEQIALLLAHLDNRLDHLRDLLAGMLSRRDQWLRHLAGRKGEDHRRLLENALRSLVESRLDEIRASIPPSIGSDLAELAPFAAANLLKEGKDGPLTRLAALESLPGATAEDLVAWQGMADLLLTGGGELRRAVNKTCGFPADRVEPCLTMKARMKEVLEWLQGEDRVVSLLAGVRSLPPVVYEEEQWRILHALLELLPLAAAELWLIFRENGKADFAEIALKARQSLHDGGNPTELLLRMDAAVRHILVDEFQDTSNLQFDLLELLTEGWTLGDGRTLFLVGDPMQSIYRFREAEVGLFLRARKKGLRTIPLEALELRVNFRSQEGIVQWVNRAFRVLFPDKEDAASGAVPLSSADAVHKLLDGPAVEFHPLSGRNDEKEARTVVEIAANALQSSKDESVAVLVRSRTHLMRVLPALREAGLRYQARDIDPLGDRPAARDIVSLTRAILHPEDRLSWLAVLRAPWCGLTLSDLHALCGGRSTAIPRLMSDNESLGRLSADGRRRVERTAEILRATVGRRGKVGLRRLVEGCWLALGGPVLLEDSDMEDADRVFDLLEEIDHGGDLQDFQEMDDGLSRLFAASDAGADGRLQIMTIHKAKGLEFDTVILPGLGRRPGKSDPPLLRWLDHPDYGLLLGPIHPRDGISRDPIYDAIGKVEKEKDDLETTRLLYVTTTRARKRIHLLGHAPLNAKGECRPQAGSLLHCLWPVAEEAFSGLENSENRVTANTDAPRTLRRLPSGWNPPPLSTAPLPKGTESKNPSEMGRADDREIVFAPWQAETARHVGTVVHALLERIGREGPEDWISSNSQVIDLPTRRFLAREGVPSDEIPGALEKVHRALRRTLSGKRGLWILARRPEAACEFEISGQVEGRIVHAVIDRTFVDEKGVRWVVDYKTSEPRGGESSEAFLAAEMKRYYPQIAAYVGLFRQLEPGRVVGAGLYFPLMDAWREIPLK